MKETKIEKDSADLASLLGWLAYKGTGRPGAADKIFVKAGRVFMVEFKKPGESQKQAQKDEQVIVESNGTSYHIVTHIGEMRDVLLIEEEKFVART